MKKKKFEFLKMFILLFGLLPVFLFTACSDDDDPIEDPIATFQYEISEENFLEVIFMNFSSNATTYSWNFGDGNSSTEENPTHVYEEVGDYDVTLTASNAAGATHSFSQTIEVKDPDEALALLAGQTSKTWKLYRIGESMGVGPNVETPYDWWFLENNGARPCLYYHEFTFNRNMEYIFDDKGSFWGEGGVFPDELVGTCFEATAANMVNADGVDVSAWLSGTHQFEYNPSTNRVTLIGEGAWIGIPKVGTDGEVTVPQTSVSFNISIEEHDGYDHMVIQFLYDGVVWQFNYASYTNPALEPDVVSFMVDFSYSVEGSTVTFENESKDAVSYSWDFGDGNTSTEENPIHTYDADGAYTVVLTGTSASGESKDATKTVTIDTTTLTEAPPTPTQDEADVISIYSHIYTDIADVNLDPDWGQATVTEEVEVEGQNVLKMAGLNYQGISWENNVQDVSDKTYLHVDVWCAVETDINISLIGNGENPVTNTTEAGMWVSLDIPLSEYTTPDLTQTIQLKFDDAGSGAAPTIYVANIYFY